MCGNELNLVNTFSVMLGWVELALIKKWLCLLVLCKLFTIVPTKSDSHVIFCLQVLSLQYNATHKILTCVLHVRSYCSVVVMSTALDAGVPGSNLFRGCCFFFFIFLLGPKGTGGIISAYCKFGSFREILFSRNFSHAKVRENKIIAKWRNHSVVYLP